jgi:hypothetical protein
VDSLERDRKSADSKLQAFQREADKKMADLRAEKDAVEDRREPARAL